MKKHIAEFCRRGLLSCWGGPVILAIIYIILHSTGVAETVSTFDAAKAIITIMLLAFIAAGITVVYTIEKLPLFSAILIHGVTLYLDYLIIYLVNNWLSNGAGPLIIFTAAFFGGYAVIWLIIFLITRSSAARLNRSLRSR